MSDFRKGQLVAVRDKAGQDWTLRVYDHASPEGLHFCCGLDRFSPPCWWNQVQPAEAVWHSIFLGEHDKGFKAACADCDAWKKCAQLLDKRINWLCSELLKSACPPHKPNCQHRNDKDKLFCAMCWRRAGRRAVEDGADGKRDS